MSTAVHPLQDIRRACRAAGRLARDELIGIAIARGCRHYAAFVPPELVKDRPDLPHEVLGCALLVGPQDVETFRGIRVGAMILSDAGNSAHTMADAAAAFDVTARLLHIARIGQKPITGLIFGVTYWRTCRPRIVHRRPGSCRMHRGFQSRAG